MKNKHTINTEETNAIIKVLTTTRNNINEIRSNVRFYDAGTTMCMLASELWNLDAVIEKLNSIKTNN